MMYVSTDSGHTARTSPKMAADFGGAFGERLHQKCADCIDDNCDESFEPEHAAMMALSGANVKAGKRGCLAFLAWRGRHIFPSFQVLDSAVWCCHYGKRSAHHDARFVPAHERG